MKKEIEIRYQLLNKNDVFEWLNANAKFLFSNRQIDTYYDSKNCSFIKDKNHVYDWLRIREENNEFILNYKHWLPEGELIRTYCNEYEVKLSSLEEMENILKNIGFYKLITVDKLRKCWLYNDIEIDIDSVKGLGDYIELEYKGVEEKQVNNIIDKLKHTLEVIGANVANEDHEGHAIKLIRKI